MSFYKNKIWYFLLGSLLVVSCQKKNKGCENVMCTEEFRMITLMINDTVSSSDNRVLTKFYTKNKKNDTLINSSDNAPVFDWDYYQHYGYPVITDGQLPRQTDSLAVEFFGEVDNKIVVQETLIVGCDCCHIFKVRGKDSTTMQP